MKLLCLMAALLVVTNADCDTGMVQCLDAYTHSTGDLRSAQRLYDCLAILTCDPGSAKDKERLHGLQLAAEEIEHLTPAEGESSTSRASFSFMLIVSLTFVAVLRIWLRA
ncbi:uncharacterized protein LOC129926031 [Biomphalaria glabrata]|uniref:Uncharacterized protein LOC129926031 n=1 Tax=Biomphalaria glabrata TaxID=6526 RepID=A0A9W3A903_BIOGL|nr:uncharacterized protein LOC129926031 [Biomphalaria glabrata]